MSTPQYQVGEILGVTLPAVKVTSVSETESGEIGILLECPSGGLYRMDIPLNTAVIRRITPAEGEPQPGQLWADVTGAERYAHRENGAVYLINERGLRSPWQAVHGDPQIGPITRVRPPAAPQPDADEPRAPRVMRLMLDDVWEDRVGDIWRVVADATAVGGLGLTLGDHLCTWGEVDGAYGPLTLIERAGYRRTTDTVTAGQLRPGMVVSHPDWWGDTPVELLTGTSAEFTYRMLGEDEDGPDTVIAAPCATLTVWAGQAVTA